MAEQELAIAIALQDPAVQSLLSQTTRFQVIGASLHLEKPNNESERLALVQVYRYQTHDTLLALVDLLGTTTTDPYTCTSSGETWTCDNHYDVGLVGDVFTLRLGCDPEQTNTCPTNDGYFDAGGVLYDACLSPSHARNGGHPSRDWPHCPAPGLTPPLPSMPINQRISIFDEQFGGPDDGSPTGGAFCTDIDGDSFCGNTTIGETFEPFCGQVTLSNVDASNLHALAYFVAGPVGQAPTCPGSGNLVGGTRGTISIRLNASSTPSPSPGFAGLVRALDVQAFEPIIVGAELEAARGVLLEDPWVLAQLGPVTADVEIVARQVVLESGPCSVDRCLEVQFIHTAGVDTAEGWLNEDTVGGLVAYFDLATLTRVTP